MGVHGELINSNDDCFRRASYRAKDVFILVDRSVLDKAVSVCTLHVTISDDGDNRKFICTVLYLPCGHKCYR